MFCKSVHGRYLAAVVFGVLSYSAVAVAADGDDAMFGLKWGMSVSEVRSVGVQLQPENGEGNIELFTSTSLPKDLSNVESYLLVFADGKLVKLRYLSTDVSGDVYGIEGKEIYGRIKSALAEKYGVPTANFEHSGGRLYDGADEFYQCLAYDGCGAWVSFFESPDKKIMLELKGLRRGVGYLSLTAEAEPQWSEAMDRREKLKNRSDKDAL